VNTKKVTVAGFFAGVGGIELGFELAGFEPVFANEIDKKATVTYGKNHKSTLLIHDDIKNIKPGQLPKQIDVIAGGFPCQAFSVAGYRLGFDDPRGTLYFDLLKLIVSKKPQVVFLENVRNLVSHDGGNTFHVILESLEMNGYFVSWKVMNAKDFGNIPQTRERIYIVAFRSKRAFEKFSFPEKITLKVKLRDFIDFDKKMDEKYYYRENRPMYRTLLSEMKSKDTLYQWRRHYVRENKSQLSPTLTANMGTGGHNVPLIVTKHGIRKLTPRECFNLMGFPKDFILPAELPDSHLYKQAGNAVVVPVIKAIAQQIAKALD
jgi:DNA (cytosine-5)-methyltransferase 1